MTRWFEAFARRSAEVIGSAYAFVGLLAVTVLWLALGAWLHWTDTWQLTFTTALTVATQLTAMLIQSSQNRQERAMQLKLDELIRVIEPADNRLRGIEEVCDNKD